MKDKRSLFIRVLRRMAKDERLLGVLEPLWVLAILLGVPTLLALGIVGLVGAIGGGLAAIICVFITCAFIVGWWVFSTYQQEKIKEKEREWAKEDRIDPWRQEYEGFKLRAKNYWGKTEEDKKKKLEELKASARSVERWSEILRQEKERLEKVNRDLSPERLRHFKELAEKDEEHFNLDWIIDFLRIPEIELDAAKAQAALDGQLVDQRKKEEAARETAKKRLEIMRPLEEEEEEEE